MLFLIEIVIADAVVVVYCSIISILFFIQVHSQSVHLQFVHLIRLYIWDNFFSTVSVIVCLYYLGTLSKYWKKEIGRNLACIPHSNGDFIIDTCYIFQFIPIIFRPSMFLLVCSLFSNTFYGFWYHFAKCWQLNVQCAPNGLWTDQSCLASTQLISHRRKYDVASARIFSLNNNNSMLDHKFFHFLRKPQFHSDFPSSLFIHSIYLVACKIFIQMLVIVWSRTNQLNGNNFSLIWFVVTTWIQFIYLNHDFIHLNAQIQKC